MEAAKKASKIYEHDSLALTKAGRELASFEDPSDVLIRVEEGEKCVAARLPCKGEVFSFSAADGQSLRAQVVDITFEPPIMDGRQGDQYGAAYLVKVL